MSEAKKEKRYRPMMCPDCKRDYASRFCPDCGRQLRQDAPLMSLLKHVRSTQQLHEDMVARLEEGACEEGMPEKGAAALTRRAGKRRALSEKWKAWGDALENLLKEETE